MALTDGLIGCWSPGVKGSGYLLPDLSTRRNHGTLSGMTAADWVPSAVRGQHQTCVQGDANDNVITTALRLPTSSMSYGGWINPTVLTGFPNNRPFGEADAGGGAAGSSLLIEATGAYAVFRGGTATDINARTASANPLRTWSLYVVVLGSRPELYKDSVLIGSSSGTTIASWNNGFRILADANSINFGWNGLVGEVCVWNRPILQSEIADWFRKGSGAIGRQLTGQTRRPVYGAAPSFRPAWALRRSQIIGGGLR